MTSLLETLTAARVVPVIRHRDLDIARAGSRLLAEAGFPVLEITMTVPRAERLIADLAAELPDAVIGAGTVLTTAAATAAIDAGARFVVSPCWSDAAHEAASARGVPYLPGAATPTEIFDHWRRGAALVKVFPAREAGGPGFLKAMKSVFPDIPLMPTGGIRPVDVEAYIAAGALCVGLGGELFPASALQSGDEQAARAAIDEARAQAGGSNS